MQQFFIYMFTYIGIFTVHFLIMYFAFGAIGLGIIWIEKKLLKMDHSMSRQLIHFVSILAGLFWAITMVVLSLINTFK